MRGRWSSNTYHGERAEDRGFEWLTKAFDARAGYVTFANVFPAFDGVRSDPRFKVLVARLKLPD